MVEAITARNEQFLAQAHAMVSLVQRWGANPQAAVELLEAVKIVIPYRSDGMHVEEAATSFMDKVRLLHEDIR